jgi:tRNA dimethylallyltransferase
MQNKIITILGQTSTGKSDFAVEIAKKINGEIISADSRQVYKNMDLGSGKITKKEMKKVPHHLLDIISPKKVFSVSDFQKKASKIIEEIEKRNNTPIICGGTGFYIDAVINNIPIPEVPPNKKLREKLSKKSKEELFKILIKLDSVRASTIDKNNPVRLIRAIEITKAIGKVPPHVGHVEKNNNKKIKVLKIGLKIPDEILKEKIKLRLLSRIKKGMIKEIKVLHENRKISWKRLESFGLEYRYVSYYLQGKLSKNEMVEKLNTEIWHFAKRQNTWFKRDKNIIWINPLNEKEKNKAFIFINKFLQ